MRTVITLARDGVLPVDKPEGPTSHDVVAMARRALGTRRIGHTGTLDPFASGLLLLCIDKATRLAEYFSDLPKEYVAVARLGARTDTDDREGRVLGVLRSVARSHARRGDRRTGRTRRRAGPAAADLLREEGGW